MTAGVLRGTRREPGQDGLRAVRPRTDMAGIAALIQVSFGEDLDPAGRKMIQAMQVFGGAGLLGWLISRLVLPPAARPRGFVWERNGELVGNASLLPVEPNSERWVLANVAVHPDHRRQGIGRRMVAACLALAREEGAGEVLLQVRSDNREAQSLYRSMGFNHLCVRGRWVRPPFVPSVAAPSASVRVRRRRPEDWRRQWALARRLFPEGLQWPYPLSRAWFEPTPLAGLLAVDRSRHWVATGDGDEMRASLTARISRDSGGWQLGLLVEPADRGRLEYPLLRTAIRELAHTGLSLTLSYPVELIDEGLADLGFRHRRTLAWMGAELH